MNMQTSYPVFEASQVLSSNHLNDLTEYLEQQDRLSRRALSGIGVVCGFDVDIEGALVSISKGVAVTSEGFLITAESQVFDRVRPYDVPVPTAEEASEAEIAEARYPFLFPDGENQIPVFEMLDTDFAPAPGEPDPDALTAAFLADKTVMLFLECRLESLKNCDVNDCSDKGAERRFTLRRLLVTRAQADAMLAKEAEIAERPVDRANHPRLALPHLRIEKLGLARHEVDSFGDLFLRILTIGLKLAPDLQKALRAAYAAYDYLLGDLYAEGEEPFPDLYLSNVSRQLTLNIFLIQYFYDYLRDVALAYNEFVETAACFEAECLPNPDRFPKHVLLGDAVDEPDAFTITFASAADAASHNQLTASSGAGLQYRPAARRTHFVPSPAAQNEPRLEEVRALFLRMHLLALTYRTQGLLAAPIRVTPSRTDAAPLSERAIPFHYAFNATSDLFRNWSPRKTKARLLSTVYSYRFSAPDDQHPLWFRIDDQDFIRVEGIVGKPLGSAMAELIAYKEALGLPFSIEPVFMRLAFGDDDKDGQDLDREAAAVALAAARKLLLCRLSDLDFIFLVLIGAIFAFLVFLIQRLGPLTTRPGSSVPPGAGAPAGPGNVTTGPAAAAPIAGGQAGVRGATAFLDPATARRFRLDISPEAEKKLRVESDLIRADIRKSPFVSGDIVARLNPKAEEASAAAVFAAVKDPEGGGNLFDRTRAFIVKQGGDETAVQAAYAPVALMAQSEQLMSTLSVESIADFDEVEFATAFRGFSDAYQNYATTVLATPAADEAVAQEQAQIAAAADTVATQATGFAAANIQTELTAAVQRLFESLTLKGYAKRHPGLEHHAGVPKGGTLVLAYVSLDDLQKQAGPILTRFGTPAQGLTTALATGSGLFDLPNAFQELAAAVEERTSDPLDRFVVLADFCLPYQCCDTDCSDVALSERIKADPFGDTIDAGPMVVPPLDPPASGPSQPPSVGFIGRDFRPITGRPVLVANAFVARGLTGPREPFVPPERVARGDPGRGSTPPAPGPGEVQEDGVISGVVGIEMRDGTLRPLADSAVVFTDASGQEQRQNTEDGVFKISVPAGLVRIRGVSPGHRGISQEIKIEAGQALEVMLPVTPQG